MTRARILADYVSGGTTAAEFDYLDGVTSNVQTQLDAKSPTTGHANIATVGTVATGTWEGTDVAVAHGGTGASTHTANNVLVGAGTSAITSVAPGADGQVLTSTGTVWQSEAAAGGGITEADTWRLNSTFTGVASPMSSNLERDDSYGEGLLGTGMTVSSGIFSFPSTGFWQVDAHCSFFYDGDTQTTGIIINTTPDDGSNWYAAAISWASAKQTEGYAGYNHTSCTKIIDVDDISNVKVRFIASPSVTGVAFVGNSLTNHTYFVFKRLADT